MQLGQRYKMMCLAASSLEAQTCALCFLTARYNECVSLYQLARSVAVFLFLHLYHSQIRLIPVVIYDNFYVPILAYMTRCFRVSDGIRKR